MKIFTWCLEHNYPKKMCALLEHLGAEEEDLNEWTIEFDGNYSCMINDSEYEIYDEEEFLEIKRCWISSYIDEEVDYLDIPEHIKGYIDKNQMNIDYFDEIEDDTIIEECQEIWYNQEIYYYVEL